MSRFRVAFDDLERRRRVATVSSSGFAQNCRDAIVALGALRKPHEFPAFIAPLLLNTVAGSLDGTIRGTNTSRPARRSA
jgi:hypothetical protein